MIKKIQFSRDQSAQPVSAIAVTRETKDQRFQRLKRTAEVTGRRFVQVYLEDEKKRKRDQR